MNNPQHTHRLRIPPSSPRAHHAMGSQTYSRESGWYPITEDQARELERVRLFDMNPASPPLFQIVTVGGAVEIDREENRARRGTAQNPINPATGRPYDEEQDALAQELAAQRAQNELMRGQLASLAAALHGVLPGGLQADLAAQLGLEPAPVAKAAPEALPASASAPAKADPKKQGGNDKPARPGARGGVGEKPAPEKKPEAPAPPPVQGVEGTPADPLGSGAAIKEHDAGLAEAGATLNR